MRVAEPYDPPVRHQILGKCLCGFQNHRQFSHKVYIGLTPQDVGHIGEIIQHNHRIAPAFRPYPGYRVIAIGRKLRQRPLTYARIPENLIHIIPASLPIGIGTVLL